MKRIPIQIRVPIVSDKQDCCPYEKPFGYIYMIVNKVTGHYYIGKHKFNHPWLDKSYKGSGKALQDAYNSKDYSFEDFETSVLEWANSGEELNNLEIYWIDMFGAYEFPFHYNLTPGGDEVPMEFLLGENNPNYGGKYTPSGKDAFMYGKRHTEETRKKMSENHADFRGSNHPNYNKPMSEQQKELLRIINKGKKLSSDTKHKMSKTKIGVLNPSATPVVQLDIDDNVIQVYDYMKQATDLGYSDTCIGDCCRGKQKTHKGYKWMYLEDFINKGGKIDVY